MRLDQSDCYDYMQLEAIQMQNQSKKPAFLIDLDGTMYAGDDPIPGAGPFIHTLRAKGIPYLFVTNNSSRTPEAVASHLLAMGVQADPEEIVTSSQAAAQYAAAAGRGRRVFMIGEAGLELALREAGLELVEEEPDFVVQGIDRAFTYDKLERAVSFIRAGAEYILTNPDRLLPAGGRLVPGAGAISGSIREATQTDPVTIGKPYGTIMRFALERLRHEGEVWVIGDSLHTDIGAGHSAGLRTALVLTGVVTPEGVEQALQAAGSIQPDLIARDLPELAGLLDLDGAE